MPETEQTPIVLKYARPEVVRRGRFREFWRRQFAAKGTRPQVAYDIMFGLLMPAYCILLDPFVLNVLSIAPGGAGAARIALVTEMLALAIWLALSGRVGALRGAFAGTFTIGGVMAFAIGIPLVPFAAIVLHGFGVFGFMPVFAAFVFVRNAWRAMKQALQREPLRNAVMAYACGLAFCLAAGYVICIYGPTQIRNAARTLKARADAEAVATLHRWGPILGLDEVVKVWSEYRLPPDAKYRLGRTYLDVMGYAPESREEQLDIFGR